jgi:hypothetical protein
MGQTLSFDDAEHATMTPTVGVPMLDWSRDLFSDNASLADLVAVDFLLQCDSEFMPQPHQSEELCIQLAA